MVDSSLISSILSSPLMYIFVIVFATYFMEWEIRRQIKKILHGREVSQMIEKMITGAIDEAMRKKYDDDEEEK